MAEIYDFVMSHVNYMRWSGYVARLIQRVEKRVEWIHDISCGTGNHCYFLSRLGFRVSGHDASREMVKKATEKVDALFWCSDMRRFALKKKPDMIVSLYDSMNYLRRTEDWLQCLDSVFSNLPRGGLFLFDVSTLHNSVDIFKNYVDREKGQSGSYVRRSYFEKKTRTQVNEFEIRLKREPDVIFCETHRQTIRPLDEINRIIDFTPFELLGFYGDFTFLPGSEKSERVHFLLQK